jgi:hypothetical protein
MPVGTMKTDYTEQSYKQLDYLNITISIFLTGHRRALKDLRIIGVSAEIRTMVIPQYKSPSLSLERI